MAVCSRCGGALEQNQKFCGACGTAVPLPAVGGGTQLISRSSAPPSLNVAAKTDPFAQTVLGQQLEALPPPQVPQSVSPMAASVMATPAAIAQAMARPQAPIRTAPPPPPPPAPFGPGSAVLVLWGDGHRYPGKVVQASGQKALIAFPNGAHHWVDMQWISVPGP